MKNTKIVYIFVLEFISHILSNNYKVVSFLINLIKVIKKNPNF